MKKGLTFAAPVTVALILGLLVYAVPAMGTSSSLASRVAKLEASNKKLVVANTKLTKRVASLESFTSCNESVAPVSVEGDPAAGSGFYFTPDNKVTTTLFKGIVPTPTGTTPDDYLQLVDADCVAGSAGPHASATRSH